MCWRYVFPGVGWDEVFLVKAGFYCPPLCRGGLGGKVLGWPPGLQWAMPLGMQRVRALNSPACWEGSGSKINLRWGRVLSSSSQETSFFPLLFQMVISSRICITLFNLFQLTRHAFLYVRAGFPTFRGAVFVVFDKYE